MKVLASVHSGRRVDPDDLVRVAAVDQRVVDEPPDDVQDPRQARLNLLRRLQQR